jgi:hypothetical protein
MPRIAEALCCSVAELLPSGSPASPPRRPFIIDSLTVIGHTHGFTLWHCKATKRLAEVLAPAFFDDAAGLLTTGDLVLVSAPDGAAEMFVADTAPLRMLVLSQVTA